MHFVTQRNVTKFTKMHDIILYGSDKAFFSFFLSRHLGDVNSGKAIENPSTESIETVADHSRQGMRRHDEEVGIAGAGGDQGSEGKGQGGNSQFYI